MRKTLLTIFLELVLIQCFSQVQRMRIPIGEYLINGATSIPSMCIDRHLAPPTSLDLFENFTSNISVTQKIDNQLITKPLSEVNGKWIKITGSNEGIEEIKVIPVDPIDNAEYILKVTDNSGILGGKSQIVTTNLPDEKVYQTYETAINTIQDKVLKSNLSQSVIWKVAESAPRDEIEEIISEYKILDTKISSISNEKIREEVRWTAMELIERVDKYVQLSKNYEKLVDAFGAENKISVAYLSENIVIPISLQKYGKENSLTDIISLYYGQKINDAQATVLSEITGLNFNKSTKEFDNAVLIRSDGYSYSINTTSSTEIIDDFTSNSFSTKLKDKTVYIDLGEYSFNDELANWLKSNGVDIVFDLPKFLDKSTSTGKIKPIIISSKNPTKVKQLFETEHGISEIIDITIEAEKINNAIVVENQQQLDEVISKLNQDEIPLVIFNNGSDGIMFEEPFDPNKLKYGISCNTYEYNFYSRTTDFIDFKCVIKAVIECQLKYGVNNTSMNDYMKTYQEVYEKCLFAKTTRIKAGLLMVGGTLIGGTIYGYYEINKEEN